MPHGGSGGLFYATPVAKVPYYWHEHIGYNYHLERISAGIGREPDGIVHEAL